MKKKITLALVAAGSAVAVLPLFAAFEAHVINVTAKIENALSVPIEALDFGTVFPQEQLEQDLRISLSGSFLDEDRVDDVEYIIRQKPKCGVTEDDGEVLIGPTWTGHVVPTLDNPATLDVDESEGGTAYTIDCDADEPANLELAPGQTAGLLPSLCEYISKHGPDENDGDLESFHQAFTVASSTVLWTDTAGRLAKSDTDAEDQTPGDTVDNWIIDLSVPCFGNHCAQDWADFVTGINPTADPDDYVQDIANEHKIFGCNLWVEVTGVSEAIN